MGTGAPHPRCSCPTCILSPDRPAALAAFHAFAAGPARAASAVYILGDLFDWWVGDDQMRGSVRREGRRVAARRSATPACRCSSAAAIAISCSASASRARPAPRCCPTFIVVDLARHAARCCATATSCAPTTPNTRPIARACATPTRRRACCACPTSCAPRDRVVAASQEPQREGAQAGVDHGRRDRAVADAFRAAWRDAHDPRSYAPPRAARARRSTARRASATCWPTGTIAGTISPSTRTACTCARSPREAKGRVRV